MKLCGQIGEVGSQEGEGGRASKAKPGPLGRAVAKNRDRLIRDADLGDVPTANDIYVLFP
jgi:hypothetical protein